MARIRDWTEAHKRDLVTVTAWATRKWPESLRHRDRTGLSFFLDKLGAGSFVAWCSLSQTRLLDVGSRSVVDFVIEDHAITLPLFLRMNAGAIKERFPKEFPKRVVTL